jgi:GTP-binding protein Era
VTRAGTVAIAGRANVGKSTLLNALLGERLAIVSPHPQTTRETVRGVLTRGDAQYVFIDTPGLHAPRSLLGQRMNRTSRAAVRDADATVLVVDASAARDEDLSLAAELAAGSRTVVALNKIDRLSDKAELLPALERFGKAAPLAAIVPVSARKRDGLAALLDELRALLPEQAELFEPDTLSDQPVRFFVAEIVREQILAHTRQEVPHGVAVVVERFDEAGKRPRIDIAVHVARDAHTKILVGARGSMLKTINAAARARIDQLLGRPVHLRLHVRATPGWMDDPQRLHELGYGGD